MTERTRKLIELARNWAEAIHHENMGMGSASGRMAAATDAAAELFTRELGQATPREVANAILETK